MLVLISPSLGFSSVLSHCLLLPALTSSHPCLQWISSPCPQSPKATCTQVLPIDCGLDNSVQFSHSVMSNSLRSHRLQHTRPPCPSPTLGAYSNSCPLSQWCHPDISSSVVPFSCPQSFSASGSFQWVCSLHQRPKHWSFSFSTSLSNEYSGLISFRIDWLISLQSKGLSRVFCAYLCVNNWVYHRDKMR